MSVAVTINAVEHFERRRLAETVDGQRDVEAAELSLWVGDDRVGVITWVIRTGEIEWLFVAGNLRRRGLGTHLWNTAGNRARLYGWPQLQHSAWRTKDGQAWALAMVGGDESALPGWRLA